jgi:hypothetical protein
MGWWRRFLLRRAIRRWPAEAAYAVPFRLYSKDGKRAVEVRVRRDGLAYFVDQELAEESTYRDRGDDEIGPFDTPEAAEAAAIARRWFSDGEDSD